eukprot:363803-Chlamydomonas_euryale.AAC.3
MRTAITATGVIWSRYSTQITPVNYNLLAVNAFIMGWHQALRAGRACTLTAVQGCDRELSAVPQI